MEWNGFTQFHDLHNVIFQKPYLDIEIQMYECIHCIYQIVRCSSHDGCCFVEFKIKAIYCRFKTTVTSPESLKLQ